MQGNENAILLFAFLFVAIAVSIIMSGIFKQERDKHARNRNRH